MYLEACLQQRRHFSPFVASVEGRLGGLLPIGFCIIVHDSHVVNTVCPVGPEVLDQKGYLLFRGLWWRVPLFGVVIGSGGLGFRPHHGATLVYEGVVVYVIGGECPARQIRDPVTELIVTRRDKAAPLAVEGVAY